MIYKKVLQETNLSPEDVVLEIAPSIVELGNKEGTWYKIIFDKVCEAIELKYQTTSDVYSALWDYMYDHCDDYRNKCDLWDNKIRQVTYDSIVSEIELGEQEVLVIDHLSVSGLKNASRRQVTVKQKIETEEHVKLLIETSSGFSGMFEVFVNLHEEKWCLLVPKEKEIKW